MNQSSIPEVAALTLDQIDKLPEGLDASEVDPIRDRTNLIVKLNEQLVVDEAVAESTRPSITYAELRNALTEHLEDPTKPKATARAKEFVSEKLAALDVKLDSEGAIEPRLLRDITVALETKLSKEHPSVQKKCRALLTFLNLHDSDCIAEEKVFTKRYILELIVLFALSQKLDLTQLEITTIRTNKNGALLVLEAKFPTADGGYRQLSYVLKGRHGDASKQSATTNIDQSFWDAAGQPDCPDKAGTIAEYENGKWSFINNSVSSPSEEA
jgi:hypothetical protein